MAGTRGVSSEALSPSGQWRGRAIILVAIVVFALSLRTAVTSLTPLLERISSDLGFSDTISGLLGMLATLCFGLAGLIAPKLERRYGLEQVTLGAVIITAVGIGSRALSDSVTALAILSGVALFGMGVGNILLPPLVKRYFPERIAPVSTLYIVFVQLGTMLPAAMAIPIADATNWRLALAVWAIIPIAALGPWVWVVLARRAGQRRAAGEAAITSVPASGIRVQPWRIPMAWGLTLMFGMTSACTYAIFTWLPKIITSAGGSEALGGTMLAVFSAVGLAATFFAPSLCTRFSNPFGFTVAFALSWFTGFAGLMWAPLAAPWLWALLCGIGPTTFPMALTLINVRTRTSVTSASLSGFSQGVGYLIACSGPLLFGVLHDATNGWGWSFAVASIMVVLMLGGSWTICKPRYLEDQAT